MKHSVGSIFDLGVDKVGGKGDYTVKEGDYCAKIVAAQCPELAVSGRRYCDSFTDCPEICNAENVCPDLQKGQNIKYNCKGAAAVDWQDNCKKVGPTKPPAPSPALRTPSGYKPIKDASQMGGDTCESIVEKACKAKDPAGSYKAAPAPAGGVNYLVKNPTAFCVANGYGRLGCDDLEKLYEKQDSSAVLLNGNGKFDADVSFGDTCSIFRGTTTQPAISGTVQICAKGPGRLKDDGNGQACNDLEISLDGKGNKYPSYVEGFCEPTA